jgi:hypothetical protein
LRVSASSSSTALAAVEAPVRTPPRGLGLRESLRLIGRELQREGGLGLFGFDRHLFPERLLVLGLAQFALPLKPVARSRRGVPVWYSASVLLSAKSSARSSSLSSFGGDGGTNGPDLKAALAKVRWNQMPSCQVILRTASAVRWSPTIA